MKNFALQMMKSNIPMMRVLAFGYVACVSLSGCRSEAVTPPRGVLAPAVRGLLGSPLRVDPSQFLVRDRKDTPWTKMTDAQLADEIGKVHGRVMIGLKARGSSAGMDGLGQPLVDAATVAQGKIALKSLGLKFLFEFRNQPAIVADMPVSVALIVNLRANQFVDYVEPDAKGGLLSEQTTWNVSRVQAPSAWGLTTGSGVKLLILDSGVGPHQDLNVSVGFRCVDTTQAINDMIGHGTAVAGVAAALSNSLDVRGIAYGASLWSANVIDATGYVSSAEVACAIDVGRTNGVFAVNMSFHLPPTTTVTDAIASGYSAGMFFAAAAGNNGNYSGEIDYPATLSQVVAVAAVDSNNVHSLYSSFGAKIELSAPADTVITTGLSGATICAATITSTVGKCVGTSIASPHVAAAAALLKAYNPSWSNIMVRQRLDCSGLYLGDTTLYGNGLLRIHTALVGAC